MFIGTLREVLVTLRRVLINAPWRPGVGDRPAGRGEPLFLEGAEQLVEHGRILRGPPEAERTDGPDDLVAVGRATSDFEKDGSIPRGVLSDPGLRREDDRILASVGLLYDTGSAVPLAAQRKGEEDGAVLSAR